MVLVKNFNFSMFFIFGKINQQNVFGVILESQKAFFKKGPFSKGAGMVHWSNVEIFSMFLFLAKSASKMYLTIIILERKKRSF